MIYKEQSSLQQVIDSLLTLKRYKPFEYSGKYFVAYHAGFGYIYRSKQTLLNRMAKLGIESLEMAVVG